MKRTEEALKASVRETPLVERLNECRKRIADMCAKGRGPRMTIPVEHYDDDFYICTTLEDAIALQAALDAEREQSQLWKERAEAHDEDHLIINSLQAALDAEREKFSEMTASQKRCWEQWTLAEQTVKEQVEQLATLQAQRRQVGEE